MIDECLLVVSELVTNAVTAGRTVNTFESPHTTTGPACHDRSPQAPTIGMGGDSHLWIHCHAHGGYSASHMASKSGRMWRSPPGLRSPLSAGSSRWQHAH